ncbi:MAG: hypothetical protein IID51_07465 [Proteobacteria bacterium]|nr:hypothetical protein [Pseudomonadota bacterium]
MKFDRNTLKFLLMATVGSFVVGVVMAAAVSFLLDPCKVPSLLIMVRGGIYFVGVGIIFIVTVLIFSKR